MKFNLLTMMLVAGIAMPASAAQEIRPLQDSDEREAGSVRPEIRMDEQIRACQSDKKGGPARAMVILEDMQDQDGNVRVQVYGDDPAQFLETGAKLLRIDVPAEKKMRVCVTFPAPGDYALVVMHDRDADGRADVLSEGFGFSRNPSLTITAPDFDEVVFHVEEGVTEMKIRLKYLMDTEKRGRKGRRRR